MTSFQTPPQEITLEAGKSGKQYWRDLWRFRELFYFLAWRDLMVRYKQTLVGVTWAVLRPLLTMLVLTFVFGGLAGMDAGSDVPYPILVLCGMLPWQFFATSLTQSGQSLVNNAAMVSKIYFPRLIMPASSVITSLVDLAISGVILCLLMAYYQYVPSLNVLFLPFFIALAFAAAFGVGLWIAALMVRYRDFRFILPFIVQFGLYISPVGFQSGVVPEQWRLAYAANPMVGVIDGFRWSVIGDEVSPDRFRLTAIATTRPGSEGVVTNQREVVFDISIQDEHAAPTGPGMIVRENASEVPLPAESFSEVRVEDGGGQGVLEAVFVLAEPPKRGTLRLRKNELETGDSFAMPDLRNGEVTYSHRGGGHELYLPGLGSSIVLVVVINYFGIRFFRKTERTFADVI